MKPAVLAGSISAVSASPRERLQALDVFRGLAILAVVGIHSTGALLDTTSRQSGQWTVLAAAGRSLLFAVPAFLMLSSLLLTRRLLEGEPTGQFYRKRAQAVLWPYLLWSLLCALYARHVDPAHFTWSVAAFRVLVGKSFYHLYFLGVLLQLCIVLPFVVGFFRRRSTFDLVAMWAVVLSLGFYAANRWALHLPWVGSTLLWYVGPVSIGMWLGSLPWKDLPSTARRAVRCALPLAVISLAGYLPLALADMRGRQVDTFLFQIGEWLYTASAGVVLLWAAFWLSERGSRAGTALRLLGAASMQIYIGHALVIQALEHVGALQRALGVLPLLVLYVALSLAASLALGRVAAWARISRWVFGR